MNKQEKGFYREYRKIYPFSHIRGFSHYDEDRMKRKYSDCKPTLRDEVIVSNDNTFMTKEIIKEKCNCIHKNTCLRIAELLLQHKNMDAFRLLEEVRGK